MKLPNYTDTKVLIQQFHIPDNHERYQEIQDTLRRNLQNPHFTNILLLNERQYTAEELGLESIPPKLHQIVIDTRLTFYILFAFVRAHLRRTWVVASNNDIYFDKTIQAIPSLLRRRQRIDKPRFLCLLRHELRPDGSTYLLRNSITQRPLHDCQDTWAFYSEECPPLLDSFRFPMGGVLGCDNRVAYIIYKDLKYTLVNSPHQIHSFHNHRTNIRHYRSDVCIPGLYMGVECFNHPLYK